MNKDVENKQAAPKTEIKKGPVKVDYTFLMQVLDRVEAQDNHIQSIYDRLRGVETSLLNQEQRDLARGFSIEFTEDLDPQHKLERLNAFSYVFLELLKQYKVKSISGSFDLNKPLK